MTENIKNHGDFISTIYFIYLIFLLNFGFILFCCSNLLVKVIYCKLLKQGIKAHVSLHETISFSKVSVAGEVLVFIIEVLGRRIQYDFLTPKLYSASILGTVMMKLVYYSPYHKYQILYLFYEFFLYQILYPQTFVCKAVMSIFLQ